MSLYVSPWTEDTGTVNLLCVLNGVRPNKINVKWEAITGTSSEIVHSNQEFKVPKKGDEKGATLISLVSLKMEKWSSGISYKCQATDKPLSNSRNISFCSAYPSSSSSIYLEKLTLERENQTHIAADCTAVGPYGTTLSLLVDGHLKYTTKVPTGSGPKKITCKLSYRTEKWRENKNITCKAEHQCYNPLEKTINIPHSTEPTVKLFLVPKEPDSGVRTLLCLGIGMNPQIKWLKGSVAKKAPVTTMPNVGQLTVSSEMKVLKDEWNRGEIFTCQVEDQPAGVAVHQNISKCTETPPSSQTATVSIVGPSLKEKLGSGALQVTCHVRTFEAEAFSITWKMNDNLDSRQTTTTKQDNGDGTQTLTSALSVTRQEWEKKPNISCQVRHPCSSSTQEKQLEQIKDPKKPTLQIIRPSKGPLDKQSITTLLCLILDFYPADIDVYWEGNGLKLSESLYSNSHILWGTGRGDDGGYSMHSKLQIPQSQWKDGQYSCVVKHESSKEPIKQPTSNKTGEHTVKLFLVPNQPVGGVRTLLCLGTGVNPQIKWLKGSVVQQALVTTMQSVGQLTVSSEMKVQKDEWNKGEIFTCQVEDQPAGVAVHQNISKCTETPPSSQTATVSIVGPSLKEKLGSGALQVTCHVRTFEAEAFSITWKMNDNLDSRQTTTTKQDNGDGTQTLTSALSVTRQEWEKKPNISCQVRHPCSSSTQEKQLEQTKDPKKPTLQIIRPSKGPLDKQSIATLLCLILDFYPADIDVYWEGNGLKLSESLYSNSHILWGTGRGDDGGYSMHSKLQIPQSQWKNGQYSCVVKHESSKEPIKQPTSNKIGEHTVKLFLVPNQPVGGVRTLLCLGTGVNPQIKWLKGSVVQQALVTTMQSVGQLTVSSEMKVQKDEWNKGEIFTCQVEDQPAGVAVHQNISKCTETPPSSQTATVSIVGPSLKEKLGSGALQVTCHVRACEAEAFSITWKMNDNLDSRQTTTTKQDNGDGTQTLTSALSVTRQEWEKKPNISCQVRHPCSSSTQEKQLEQTKDPKKPTLQIIRPSKGPLDKQSIATLLCLILDFYPADIDVYWEGNGLKLSESLYSNSHILWGTGRGDDGGYSMHSKLQIPQSQGKDGQYSCVVKHESSKKPIKHTISSKNVFSTLEVINEEDENINNISNDPAQEDNLTEIWNTALTFIILFLVSVVYSICVTFVKVK